MVKGFEALRKLEVLNMKINCRSPSIVFLYKALLSLPLIQKFSLEAEHLDETQWNLMSKFFNTQNDLVFISFSITVARSTKRGHFTQAEQFKQISQWLYNKSRLQHLMILAIGLSIENLSDILTQSNINNNQLISLEIQAHDEIEKTAAKPEERAQGLCKFLEDQKHSLKTLRLNLLYMFEYELIRDITAAVSGLEKLYDLSFSLNNMDYFDKWDYSKLFGSPLKSEIIKYEQNNRALWYRYFASMLKKLNGLNYCKLNIYSIEKKERVFTDKIMDVFLRSV